MPFLSSARKNFGPQGRKNTKWRAFAFSSHTFTTAGVEGRYGPTLAQCQTAYSGQAWAQGGTYLDMPIQGYQRWTVPSTGYYRIRAAGAGQRNNGLDKAFGAVVESTFYLTANEKIIIAVGQYAQNINSGNGGHAGGAGGSFVARGSDYTTATPLIVGAGAGGVNNARQTESDGQINTNWYSGYNWAGVRNTNAGYGSTDNGSNTTWGAGGGGFYSNGSGSSQNGDAYGRGFRQGLVGGSRQSTGTDGGFGGGAGGHDSNENNGGGGYTGGTCGTNSQRAGGGGSYSANGSFSFAQSTNNGYGYVTITKI